MGKTEEPGLTLRLVGRLRLTAADGSDLTPRGRKAQGLLALLGVARELRRTRAFLQDKLWSDRQPEHGAASLRQELAGLRRRLGLHSDVLVTEAGWIGIDPRRITVRMEAEPDDWEIDGEPPEFCAGLDIADPEFEDWIRDQRSAVADRLSRAPQPPPPPLHRPLLPNPGRSPPEPDPEAVQPSIAVMPLIHFADEGLGRFIANGIVLDVIGRLTRFRRLDVIAHASTTAVHALGLNPREIGRRLGVRYVTQGSFWLNDRRMRITFDLVDARSEKVLWSRTFDRDREDVFEVEAEVAGAAAGGMMVEIDQLERSRVRARDPSSLAAYELCLRGLDEMLAIDASHCDQALEFFSRATGLEGAYARALSGISRVHGFQWKYRWSPDGDGMLVRAEEFALQAVEADPNDPSASAGLGWVALYAREHDRSLAAYARAMELNPSDATILAEYADTLKHSGSPREAVALFERAIRLDPYMSDHYLKDLAHTHLVIGDYEASIRTVHRMRRPQMSMRVLTASYALTGQDEAARRTAEMVRAAFPDFSAEAWIAIVPDRDPSYSATFLEGLKRAGL